jgi:hypothetical protein
MSLPSASSLALSCDNSGHLETNAAYQKASRFISCAALATRSAV